MPLPAVPTAPRGYWYESRAPRYSIMFALPLLALYEFLAAALARSTHGVRNGADVILKSIFETAFGVNGPLVFGVLLLGGMIALIIRDRRRSREPLKSSVYLRMLVESVAL